ncbi:MAG: hypothetical protein EBS01_12650 [Verrucomicrobia bacterium]|nr:hypothetical protein [Verrucomicrobiota bacterium]
MAVSKRDFIAFSSQGVALNANLAVEKRVSSRIWGRATVFAFNAKINVYGDTRRRGEKQKSLNSSF